MLYMSFVVRLTCRGNALRTHSLTTVAQFRYDDGWVRIRPEGGDDNLWGASEGIRVRHHFVCDRCWPRPRNEVLRAETLYPLLDWARENGKDEVPLG